MDELKELIELILFSGYVKEYNPVSGLILGTVGVGKTTLIEDMQKLDKILYYSDVTAFGIMRDMKKIREEKIRHIVIPDLTKVLSRQGATTQTFITFFNCLIEEGIVKISTFADSFESDIPIKCGLITCMSKEFAEYKRNWNFMKRTGFLTRILPISFDYTIESEEKIKQSIREKSLIDYSKKDENNNKKKGIELPEEDTFVKGNPELFLKLTDVANEIGRIGESKSFRPQKILQCLASANALKNKRYEVLQEDIDTVKRLSKFMNMDYNKI